MRPVQPENEQEQAQQRRLLKIGLVVVLGIIAIIGGGSATGMLPITATWVANAFGVLLVLSTVVFFFWMFALGKWTPAERKRLLVVLVLFVAASIFWSVFEQAGSTLNLFAQRNTHTIAFGFAFPPSWFQSMEPFFLIVLAPVFAWLWLRLGTHDPSSPTKFTVGLVCVAASFALLVPAAQRSLGGATVGPLWLVGTYLLQAIGELSSESGRAQCHDEARAGPHRRPHDGGLVPGDVGRELRGRSGRRAVRGLLASAALRRGGALRARRRGGAGVADQADPADAGALTA